MAIAEVQKVSLLFRGVGLPNLWDILVDDVAGRRETSKPLVISELNRSCGRRFTAGVKATPTHRSNSGRQIALTLTRSTRPQGPSQFMELIPNGTVSPNTSERDHQLWLQVALLAVLLGIVYFSILRGLVGQWWEDPNYSHGFFVPLFSAWLVWKRRDALRRISPAPTWTGLGIIFLAMIVLLLGVLGAENFLSRISLLTLVAGLVIQFRGWAFFRQVVLPWAVLFLMIPLPSIVLNEISMPLQFLASRLGSSLIAIAGVPVLREGNVIQLPSLTLDVAEACSGLRSLVTLVTMGVIYGYLYEPKAGQRLFVILSAFPVAIVANAFRIMIAGLIGEFWDPSKVEGFLHTFSGVIVFALSLILLMLLHSVFGRAYRYARSSREAI
jgi:exosortase